MPLILKQVQHNYEHHFPLKNKDIKRDFSAAGLILLRMDLKLLLK